MEKGSYVALHTIGRQDDINPPEGAIEVAGGYWYWVCMTVGMGERVDVYIYIYLEPK